MVSGGAWKARRLAAVWRVSTGCLQGSDRSESPTENRTGWRPFVDILAKNLPRSCPCHEALNEAEFKCNELINLPRNLHESQHSSYVVDFAGYLTQVYREN